MPRRLQLAFNAAGDTDDGLAGSGERPDGPAGAGSRKLYDEDLDAGDGAAGASLCALQQRWV